MIRARGEFGPRREGAEEMRFRRRRFSLATVLVVLLVIGLRALNRPGGDGAAATSPRSDDRAASTGSPSSDRFLSCPVLHVVDGDTLDVEIAGSVTPKERIRLLRINTPERDEPGFERATAALKSLVEGRRVDLVFEHPGRAERDDYGRLLAYVEVDGLDVNVELVRRGFTRFFTKYGEGRLADDFRKAEDAARAENAGLWSAEGWNVAGRDEPGPKPKRRKRRGPRLRAGPTPSRRARPRAHAPRAAARRARVAAPA